MRQADIKVGSYYANEERVRLILEIEDGYQNHPPRVKYSLVTSNDPSFPDWCDLKSFAKWAKRMVTPAWITAESCPDCEGWCEEVDFTIAGDVMVSCPDCGYVSEESTHC